MLLIMSKKAANPNRIRVIAALNLLYKVTEMQPETYEAYFDQIDERFPQEKRGRLIPEKFSL